MAIERGQVWWCDFDQHPDSRQNGIRPCVIVQTDLLNRVHSYALTIVIPMSTKGSEKIPSHVKVLPSPTNGLDGEGFAKCEQIQTVPQSHLTRLVGRLDDEDLVTLSLALKRTLQI